MKTVRKIMLSKVNSPCGSDFHLNWVLKAWRGQPLVAKDWPSDLPSPPFNADVIAGQSVRRQCTNTTRVHLYKRKAQEPKRRRNPSAAVCGAAQLLGLWQWSKHRYWACFWHLNLRTPTCICQGTWWVTASSSLQDWRENIMQIQEEAIFGTIENKHHWR